MTPMKSIDVTETKLVEVTNTTTYQTENTCGLKFAAMFRHGHPNARVVALFDSLHWARRFNEAASMFTIVDITTGKPV